MMSDPTIKMKGSLEPLLAAIPSQPKTGSRDEIKSEDEGSSEPLLAAMPSQPKTGSGDEKHAVQSSGSDDDANASPSSLLSRPLPSNVLSHERMELPAQVRSDIGHNAGSRDEKHALQSSGSDDDAKASPSSLSIVRNDVGPRLRARKRPALLLLSSRST